MKDFHGRDLIDDMHTRLSDPTRWTCDAFAEDAEGRPVDPLDERAVRWCLRGAYIRELGHEPDFSNTGPKTIDPIWYRVIRASRAVYGDGPIAVNAIHGREGALCVLEYVLDGRT